MTIPNFFIIGVAKAGSTSLYHYLKQHPHIYMSSLKEPKFFALTGEKLNFKGPGDRENVSRAIMDIKSYRALFHGVSNETAIGEASVLYLYSQNALKHIRQYTPNAKLIVILRDPVDRAYSNFLALRRQGCEPFADFSQALQEEERRIRNNWHPRWYYTHRGFYYAQLKPYWDTFHHSQIKICLYDDLCAQPVALLQAIFRFLDVDDAFIPDTSIKYKESPRVPRSKMLHTLQTHPNIVKFTLKLLLPTGLRHRIRTELGRRNLVKPSPSPRVRRKLIQIYREDILKLQNLIQRDLSAWLK